MLTLLAAPPRPRWPPDGCHGRRAGLTPMFRGGSILGEGCTGGNVYQALYLCARGRSPGSGVLRPQGPEIRI